MTGLLLLLFRRVGRTSRSRQRRALVAAVRDLPPKCRDVFVLHRFGSMSLDEIAAHLGIDRALAEARLVEALVRLSRAVDNAVGGEASERL
ncbi:sigma factor-like helix-turn-helix DNA-binding protein [Brevundimonas diminuta]|uniref:sigma factor-like helix-turn-helix DNA-binding protein n=1 Tax=Brevundimonas diminuta TaxID=293 RepID=UPI0006993CF6